MELIIHALDGQVSLIHFRFAGNEVQTFLMIIVAHDFPISLRDMTETLSHPHKVYSDGTFPPFSEEKTTKHIGSSRSYSLLVATIHPFTMTNKCLLLLIAQWS